MTESNLISAFAGESQAHMGIKSTLKELKRVVMTILPGFLRLFHMLRGYMLETTTRIFSTKVM